MSGFLHFPIFQGYFYNLHYTIYLPKELKCEQKRIFKLYIRLHNVVTGEMSLLRYFASYDSCLKMSIQCD